MITFTMIKRCNMRGRQYSAKDITTLCDRLALQHNYQHGRIIMEVFVPFELRKEFETGLRRMKVAYYILNVTN